MGNYSLAGHALALVSGGIMASKDEIKEAIEYLETRIIGNEYYDGEGDELLKQIIAYLQSRE